jgi:nickel/cobalt transporter (NicO) family protein
MISGTELLLVGAVAAVGVLHTIVPDHWVPIALIARQRGWSRSETALASLQAGTGHVLSTLAIAAIVWLAGLTLAAHAGRIVDTASSLALIGFGGWIAISAWREMQQSGDAAHSHGSFHGHGHAHDAAAGAMHGADAQRIPITTGAIEVSIFEAGVPPRFRLSGIGADAVTAETLREDGTRQTFLFAHHGTYWESVEEVPEPHQFDMLLTIEQAGRLESYETRFIEHDHSDSHRPEPPSTRDRISALADDPLYAPLRGETAVLTRHVHAHRHGRVPAAHVHWHDHTPASAHAIGGECDQSPPLHVHRHRTTGRTAMLLVLGSSPMVEGIPAFFAAAKYGIGLISAMAAVFGFCTIATYVLLCTASTAGLQRMQFGAIERYGEVLSGGVIAVVGLAFWLWPAL